MVAVIIRNKIVAAMYPVSTRTSHKSSRLIERFKIAIINAASAPAAPASTGVTMPPYIPPKTTDIRSAIGNSFFIKIQTVILAQSSLATSLDSTPPTQFGAAYAITKISIANAIDNKIPGMIPAINICPIDCSVTIA